MKGAPNMKILVAITVVAFVGGVGACFYQYSAMSEATAKVDDVRKKSKDEKTLNAQAERTATQLKDCADRLAHLEKSVPDFAYVPTLLQDLSAVGKQNGIEVLGVRPVLNPPKKDDKGGAARRKSYEELKIEVKGRGTYRGVIKFLTALKSFPKIVAARTATLSPKLEVGKTSTSRLDVTIELKTYVFPPAEDKTKTTAGKEVASNNG